MDQGSVDVMVDGVRCQVVQQDGERLLVQPRNGLNVHRWVPRQATKPLQEETRKLVPPQFSPEEIKHLADVLRQVFYEDAETESRPATP
jgi:hypothetical protein